MEEIEVKILDVDPRQVARTLDAMGATKVFEGRMDSIYLGVEADKNKDVMLRLRQAGDTCTITVKRKKDDPDVRVNDEYEVTVDDLQKARELFRDLGYAQISTDTRRRTSYRLDWSRVEIEEYDDIPPFIEVEAPDRETLKKVVALLGFSCWRTVRWTGKEVLDHHRRGVLEKGE